MVVSQKYSNTVVLASELKQEIKMGVLQEKEIKKWVFQETEDRVCLDSTIETPLSSLKIL